MGTGEVETGEVIYREARGLVDLVLVEKALFLLEERGAHHFFIIGRLSRMVRLQQTALVALQLLVLVLIPVLFLFG